MDNSGASGLVLCNSGASVEKMTRWIISVTLAVRGNTILSCMTQYKFEFTYQSKKTLNFKVVLKW